MEEGSRASRRGVLLGGVASAALLAAGSLPAAAEPFDRFMDLSRRLTGRAELDPRIGRLFYDALASEEPVLQTLLAPGSADAGNPRWAALEREIIGQWYTGTYRSDGAVHRATYQDALMWRAMALRGAPGQCRGELGYWSQPPAR